MTSRADTLRALLARDELLVLPCCYDALSAKMIEQAGFAATFMSGFAASASRIGAPDLGLMSYGEIADHARNINDAITIPMIGDGDTGFGNAMNVQRTVRGMARAGCAAVMIEDQVAPKRCGHTPGKAVVDRSSAFDRIRAAVDAREDDDILILARTDARHDHGLGEALDRAREFHRLGADILFVEAPQSVAEMKTICDEVPAIHMANMLEGGATPLLSQAELRDLGFSIAAYPLTLMSAAMKAVDSALTRLKNDDSAGDLILDFADLRRRIGFDEYYDAAARLEAGAR